MGGRKFQCQDCHKITSLYNSCGDRHCPQCSGSKRVDFHDKASKLILPGVTYYQVVFTLPSELSELALANRHEMADLLVGSAWKSLSRQIKTEQDYDPAAISVLHTWNQKLDAHWHVHLLVPGEGPSLSGFRWKQAEAPPDSPNSDGYHLVKVSPLREAYRKRAIATLKRLRRAGKLNLGGKFESLKNDEDWDSFIEKLESKSWVAYIQPPPSETSSANQVVRYLTRYLTGGPISDYRIVSASEEEVTFMAREGTRSGGERHQVPNTLTIREFVQKWCLHIQPEQLTKTRYFGGWCNNRQAAYRARCQALLAAIGRTPNSMEETEAAAGSPPDQPDLVCEHCGSERMEQLSQRAKPSWRELLWRESETCPSWYATLQRQSERRFWTEAYGSDFYDWYMENVVEGAEELKPELSLPIQLALPGFPISGPPHQAYLVDSF